MPSRFSIAWQKSSVIPRGSSFADIPAIGALPPEVPTTRVLAAFALASAPCAAAGVAVATHTAARAIPNPTASQLLSLRIRASCFPALRTWARPRRLRMRRVAGLIAGGSLASAVIERVHTTCCATAVQDTPVCEVYTNALSDCQGVGRASRWACHGLGRGPRVAAEAGRG